MKPAIARQATTTTTATHCFMLIAYRLVAIAFSIMIGSNLLSSRLMTV
jgi:hypothetical protein